MLWDFSNRAITIDRHYGACNFLGGVLPLRTRHRRLGRRAGDSPAARRAISLGRHSKWGRTTRASSRRALSCSLYSVRTLVL